MVTTKLWSLQMSNVMSVSHTIIPKSDQLNSEQLLGGAKIIKITRVSLSDSKEQPITINYEGDEGRPYKPCLTMRKVLVAKWGDNALDWIGQSLEVYNDPEVTWAGKKVGGIRISGMSGVDSNFEVSLTATRGKKSTYRINKLTVAESAPAVTDADLDEAYKQLGIAANSGTDSLIAAWKKTSAPVRKALGACPDSLKAVAAAVDDQSAAGSSEE
jgi:hypothetical protein